MTECSERHFAVVGGAGNRSAAVIRIDADRPVRLHARSEEKNVGSAAVDDRVRSSRRVAVGRRNRPTTERRSEKVVPIRKERDLIRACEGETMTNIEPRVALRIVFSSGTR